MNDERLRTLYAGAMARLPLPADAAPVPLEAMVDLLEQRGSEAERSQTLRAILRDPRAREEFELLRAVVRAGTPPRQSWRAAVGWQMAAGAALLVGTAWLFSLTQAPEEPLRGGESTVTMLQPADGVELTAPPLFAWRPVPNAVDYRIEIVDSLGSVVFEEQVRDTTSTGPVSGSLVPGHRYRWSVTVLTRDARHLRSATNEFRLGGP
jgi:hypothetical protein